MIKSQLLSLEDLFLKMRLLTVLEIRVKSSLPSPKQFSTLLREELPINM